MTKGERMIQNLARYFAVCLFVFSGACAAAAGGTSYATDTQVEFSGTFGVDVGLDANDKEEYYYYLKLDHPVSVMDKEFGITERNVEKIQLAIPYQFSAKPYKSRRVTVKGTLFHSFTAHHHTKILITVNEAADLRLAHD